MNRTVIVLILASAMVGCRTSEEAEGESKIYNEPHRPQFHFTPPAKWMNDPNGMVYLNGEYHLFYQHYPDGMVWGPMHWGHAVSKDLVSWEHLPIALYPDSIGMIFSGSAVFDRNNTSGLGTAENPPLVAVFTYHNAEGEKQGRIDYQTQGIAFSLDNGRSWTKYKNNPVLKNPGIKDFRDPKVFWFEEGKEWIMTLAVLDHIELYGSPDLKQWTKLSEFGKEYGSHGGVWECPDLFPMPVDGDQDTKWVLLLSINPGGPNGGSATQYFVGSFDGKTFSSETKPSDTLWLDYGPDNYAGVTWSNIPAEDGRRLFLGWMSNWSYADDVPTTPWRSAMTIPRELFLKKVGNDYRIASSVASEVEALEVRAKDLGAVSVDRSTDVNAITDFSTQTGSVSGVMPVADFGIEFSNSIDEKIIIGFDRNRNSFIVDRRKSGKTDFSESFDNVVFAPRIARDSLIEFRIVTDVSSVEVFFDDGLTVMTSLFFPAEPYSKLRFISNKEKIVVDSVRVAEFRSVWNSNK